MEKKCSNMRARISYICLVIILAMLYACLAYEVNASGSMVTLKKESGRLQGVSVSRPYVNETAVTPEKIGAVKKSLKKKIYSEKTAVKAKKYLPIVTIVVGFSGLDYGKDKDWSSQMTQGSSSMARYYSDMSLGAFSYAPVTESSECGIDGNSNTKNKANDGVIHVTIDQKHDNWCFEDRDEASMIAHEKTFVQAIKKAVERSDSFIDYSKYDLNNNNKIDSEELAVNFVFAGYEAATSPDYKYGESNYSWALSTSLDEYKEDGINETVSADGVRFDECVVLAEKEEDGDSLHYQTMGSFAHENGHLLGLPDLYDTDYYDGEWAGYDVGKYSLMASGNYGVDRNGDQCPYSLDIWSRYYLGWVKPAEINTNGTYNVDWNAESFRFLKINTKNKDEYYLLENRQFAKWDAGMKYDRDVTESNGGIMLWHIDGKVLKKYMNYNSINCTDHRPGVMPVFIEKDRTKDTLIGDRIKKGAVFFDKARWNNKYKKNLGNCMRLFAYGAGSNADRKDNRNYEDLRLTFLDDNASKMRIRFNKNKSFSSVAARIVKCKGRRELDGSSFSPLNLVSKKQTTKSITLNWNKAAGAKKYAVYGTLYGNGRKMNKLCDVSGNKVTVAKIAGKKIRKGKYYKFCVAALDQDDCYLTASRMIYAASKGGKWKNPVKMTIKKKTGKRAKAIRTITLKRGKTVKIKARISNSKKIRKFRSPVFISENAGIASVSSNGQLKAKKTGACYIRVYAQNGLSKAVKAIVK